MSGPFHTSHMSAAADAFREELAKATVSPPETPFVSSVTGEGASDPEAIRALLARQITAPVRWTQTMACLGPVPAIEVGPGRVLAGLAKRVEGGPRVESAATLAAANALEVTS